MIKSLAENIGISLFSSLLYDLGKKLAISIKIPFEKKQENEKILSTLSQSLQGDELDIWSSGVFQRFIQSPVVRDCLDDYLTYIMYGKNTKRFELKSNQILTTKTLIEKLDALLKESYLQDESIAVPPTDLERNQFVRKLYEMLMAYFTSLISCADMAAIAFVNQHTTDMCDILAQRLEKTLALSLPSDRTNDYSQYMNEYSSKLKANFLKAHVYLMTDFSLNDFYVGPDLVFVNSILDDKTADFPEKASFLSGQLFQLLPKTKWTNIFEINHIVYIIGGAGYGKTLFLQYLIGNYQEINMIDAKNYLLIYGPLRDMCGVEHSNPKSIIDFLQNCMVFSSGMDRVKLSKNMIESYLHNGRCLILLDALDEVPKEHRKELHRKIVNFFADQNPNNKVCITSRARGFIPEEKAYPYYMAPLTIKKIDMYVEKMIELKQFARNEKDNFITQAKKLIDNGFLSSFLILSLLLSIYKAERELPDTKLELYQKCFEYIARKREKEKNTRFNWNIMQSLLRDNAFMELASLCSPNNSPVSRYEAAERLLTVYSDDYGNRNEARNAIAEFLDFCSDRTEVFVPAAAEDTFKFFHRSFFDYFFSKYIVLRSKNANEIYEALIPVDLDSEIFELVISMLKNDNIQRCNQLVQIFCDKLAEKLENKDEDLVEYNILLIIIPYISNVKLIKYFVELLCTHVDILSRVKDLSDNDDLVAMLKTHDQLQSRIISSYSEAIYQNVFRLVKSQIELFNSIRNNKDEDYQQFLQYIKNNFEKRILMNLKFYSKILIEQDDEGLVGILRTMNKSWLKSKYRDSKNGRRKLKLSSGYVSQAICIISEARNERE